MVGSYHITNGTLLVCELPEERKAVPLFKIKVNDDGTRRYKARIVMKGFMQKEGIDFHDTYAPVAKWSSIRILSAIVTILNLELTHIDFEMAFMIPMMDTEVYIKTTAGMEQQTPGGKVAKMIKGINGCKQGSKLFYEEVKGTLVSIGFTTSKYDSCLFIKRTNTESCIIITWVDDLLTATDGERNGILNTS